MNIAYVGIACVITAIVGGGLKAAGIDFPAVNSAGRQVLLAVFGLLLIFLNITFLNEKKEKTEETKKASASQATAEPTPQNHQDHRKFPAVDSSAAVSSPADLSKGVVHPSAPKKDVGTWTDPDTELTWMTRPLMLTGAVSETTNYCHSLVKGRFNDWRVPSPNEASSLRTSEKNASGIYARSEIILNGSTIWVTSTKTTAGLDWYQFDGPYLGTQTLCVRGRSF